jgi:hypothetical protein
LKAIITIKLNLMANISAPAWELSKENVQPLKVGRRVENLVVDKNQQKLENEEKYDLC